MIMRLHNALPNIYTQFTEYNLFEKLSQNVSIFLIFLRIGNDLLQ